jgi:hypothetical protein
MVLSAQLAQPFVIMVQDILFKPPVHDALVTAGVASCIVPVAAVATTVFCIVHNALNTASAAKSIVQGN